MALFAPKFHAELACWRKCQVHLGTLKRTLPTDVTVSETKRTWQLQAACKRLHASCNCVDLAENSEICIKSKFVRMRFPPSWPAAEADPNSSTVAGSISPVAVIPPHKQQELLYYEIERLVKAFKGHMCALDCNNGFVNLQLKEAKVDNHYKWR
jgi:hypothetical protein